MKLLPLLIVTATFFNGQQKSNADANPVSAPAINHRGGKINQPDHFIASGRSFYDSLKAQIPFEATLNEQFRVKKNESAAIKNYLEALTFRQQLLDAGGFPTVYPASAGVYLHGKPAVNSLSALSQSLQLYRSMNDQEGIIITLNAFGTYYGIKGDLNKSVAFYREALQLKQLTGDKPGMMRISSNLAKILKLKGNYDEAIALNKEIMHASSSMKNLHAVASSLAEIADIKFLQKNYTEAEQDILKKALPMFYYKVKDQAGVMHCYDRLAHIYEGQNRFSEAKWFYVQANMVAREIRHEQGLMASLINLAHVKNTIGDYDLAIRDYKEAQQIASRNNLIDKLVEINGSMSDTYHKLGHYKLASSALNDYNKFKNQLLSTGGN